MIEYQRDQQQTIPDSQVKIVGVGGAGLNMIDRVALDGMQGVELLALASDARSLTSSVASEKVQLGAKLTMGLGCGGDPELGGRAAKEQETEIRDALRDRDMVFVCVGLGGGTGSGAAPLVTRIAREMGAFVVVFATMPFEFEGRRRREQAESALNEISVIANALVTFENARMGELVLAAQGIHEAFAAADRMISESIQAVTRLVVRPGIINVGLDDLMSSLNATRSRCLFGSGIAHGENRSQAALQNALTSPLLEKGRLLRNTRTALVHICGGEGMTLFEVELLMRELSKHVPDDAHILFGAAVDANMGDGLSVTIISSLPEDQLTQQEVVESVVAEPEVTPVVDEVVVSEKVEEEVVPVVEVASEQEEVEESAPAAVEVVSEGNLLDRLEEVEEELEETLFESEGAELPEVSEEVELSESQEEVVEEVIEAVEGEEPHEEEPDEMTMFEELEREVADDLIEEAVKSTKASKAGQAELELDGGPRGKFEGEAPNLVDGEDLDIPPYLRNKR
ncbi:cell division protein FtsZ [Rubritalea tangerina]|uniref:Cell division protein FtsZ n=1 Tax=Rubritalea tangerina TaxID=430798 RepID=A0ABW4Z8U6_9BACT